MKRVSRNLLKLVYLQADTGKRKAALMRKKMKMGKSMSADFVPSSSANLKPLGDT